MDECTILIEQFLITKSCALANSLTMISSSELYTLTSKLSLTSSLILCNGLLNVYVTLGPSSSSSDELLV